MTRDDLAKTFTGIGIELGVAAGLYSATILRNPAVYKLYSIDRWSDHHDEREYTKARNLLATFGDRSVIVRSLFDDALDQFQNQTIDFIYVDSYAHTGQYGGQLLRDWYPKLKHGGIFSGHDYDPHYQPTIDAVDEFAGLNGLTISVTDEAVNPSWFAIKP